MLSDACFDFLGEVIYDEGLTAPVLERFLHQLRACSEGQYGYSPRLLATLHDYVYGILEDVVDERFDCAFDLVWVIQCVHRACDAQGSGDPDVQSLSGAGAEPTFAPSMASLQWIVNEAVVRRIGRLAMLAQVAACGSTGPVPRLRGL